MTIRTRFRDLIVVENLSDVESSSTSTRDEYGTVKDQPDDGTWDAVETVGLIMPARPPRTRRTARLA